MKKQLFYFLFCICSIAEAQTISIVGTGVNGWPGNQIGPEIIFSTTDNNTFTISHLVITTGEIKFRKDTSWTTNWGGGNFPNGVGILNSANNIQTTAGTYDVTFTISNGTYTFIPSSTFPSIGIWGPAVDSQNGYAGQDIDMITTDGIIYTLSGFYFSSGNAYFRQDNATNFVWGSTTYPSGTAMVSGPSLFIPGGEHFVTFNRITGDYSFSFPSVGILGTALNGFNTDDTDLNTTDGFSYTLNEIALNVGEIKFRKDNQWLVNWGSNGFPNGTGVQDGVNIPINQAAVYSISFNRTTGEYFFYQLLDSAGFDKVSLAIFPNPTEEIWTLISKERAIDSIKIVDVYGKIITEFIPKAAVITIDASQWSSGMYWAKISSSNTIKIIKLIKK